MENRITNSPGSLNFQSPTPCKLKTSIFTNAASKNFINRLGKLYSTVHPNYNDYSISEIFTAATVILKLARTTTSDRDFMHSYHSTPDLPQEIKQFFGHAHSHSSCFASAFYSKHASEIKIRALAFLAAHQSIDMQENNMQPINEPGGNQLAGEKQAIINLIMRFSSADITTIEKWLNNGNHNIYNTSSVLEICPQIKKPNTLTKRQEIICLKYINNIDDLVQKIAALDIKSENTTVMLDKFDLTIQDVLTNQERISKIVKDKGITLIMAPSNPPEEAEDSDQFSWDNINNFLKEQGITLPKHSANFTSVDINKILPNKARSSWKKITESAHQLGFAYEQHVITLIQNGWKV